MLSGWKRSGSKVQGSSQTRGLWCRLSRWMVQKVPTGKVIPWKEGNEINAQSQMKEQSEKVPKVSTGNVKTWKEGNEVNAQSQMKEQNEKVPKMSTGNVRPWKEGNEHTVTDERTYLQW